MIFALLGNMFQLAILLLCALSLPPSLAQTTTQQNTFSHNAHNINEPEDIEDSKDDEDSEDIDDEGEDDDDNDDNDDDENLDDDVDDADVDYDEEDEAEEAVDDPFEAFNRKVFKFNDALDKKFLGPILEGESKLVPTPLKNGIVNFSNNFFELPRAFNYTLQANGKSVGNTLMRFLLNSTLGFFGVADVAEKLGFKKTDTNFGHTLKKWGVPPGAFIIIPFFGPNSMRGAASMLNHIVIDQLTLLPCRGWAKPVRRTTFWISYIVNLLTARSAVGQLMKHIEATAKDPYKIYRSVIMNMEK